MRFNFRVKVDLSEIFQDSRQFSWVFVDSTKIFLVKDLENHIRRLFKIEKSFRLFSKSGGLLYMLPCQEDVRVLQDNDVVKIIRDPETEKENPQQNGSASVTTSNVKDREDFSLQNQSSGSGFNDTVLKKEERSSNSINECYQTLYQTAFHDSTINTSQESLEISKVEDEDLQDESEAFSESSNRKKRKRTRRKDKSKKNKTSSESEMLVDIDVKPKPKVVNDIVLSKHVRFSEANNVGEESPVKTQNKDLAKLMSFAQSSTPLTFERKKKDITGKIEPKSEEVNMVVFEEDNKLLSPIKSERIANASQFAVNETYIGDTVSFKIINRTENEEPSVSSQIVAKIKNYVKETAQYTMQILYGFEEYGARCENSLINDNAENLTIMTLDESNILDLKKLVLEPPL